MSFDTSMFLSGASVVKTLIITISFSSKDNAEMSFDSSTFLSLASLFYLKSWLSVYPRSHCHVCPETYAHFCSLEQSQNY